MEVAEARRRPAASGPWMTAGRIGPWIASGRVYCVRSVDQRGAEGSQQQQEAAVDASGAAWVGELPGLRHSAFVFFDFSWGELWRTTRFPGFLWT